MIYALDYKKQQEAPPLTINALNCYCLFLVARLDSLASSTSISMCYYYRCVDNAYHKACFIKVVEVIV